VPGCVGWDAFLELELVQARDLPNGLHGCVVTVFHARSDCVVGRYQVVAAGCEWL
jgi:hypothetical protein